MDKNLFSGFKYIHVYLYIAYIAHKDTENKKQITVHIGECQLTNNFFWKLVGKKCEHLFHLSFMNCTTNNQIVKFLFIEVLYKEIINKEGITISPFHNS